MQTKTLINRQGMGCGFEPPPPPGVPVVAWCPPGGKVGYSHPRPTICVGYTTNLPEITEVAIARVHWKNGAIVAYCGGEQPTEDLLDAIVELDVAYSTAQLYWMTPAKEGGGAT